MWVGGCATQVSQGLPQPAPMLTPGCLLPRRYVDDTGIGLTTTTGWPHIPCTLNITGSAFSESGSFGCRAAW